MKVLISLVLFFCGFTVLGSNNFHKKTFLPPNTLHLQGIHEPTNPNMDEKKFNRVLDKLESHYRYIFKRNGAKLTILRNWDDPTVNAYAYQDQKDWVVAMFGGLARRPETTPDGFALVACHEIGHHLAGYPFVDTNEWPSNEGQSDYFSAQSCARKIWKYDTRQNKTFRKSASLAIKLRCDAAWDRSKEQDLCYRILRAGESLANLLGNAGGETPGQIHIETPDNSVVAETNPNHPSAQCRLDTYVSGALCDTSFNEKIIPGRKYKDGQNSFGAENLAAKSSCTRSRLLGYGKRPRCWFAPAVRLDAKEGLTQMEELRGNNNGILEPGEKYSLRSPAISTFKTLIDGALGVLSSSDEQITFPIQQAIYPALYPLVENPAENAFEFEIGPSYSCGKRIPLDLALRTHFGSDKNSFKFRTGRPEFIEKISSATTLEIPAGDPDGILPYSETVVEFSGKIDRGTFDLKVDIEASDLDAEEIILVLFSPTGEQIELNFFGRSGDLNQPYEVPAEDEKGRGKWELLIINFAPKAGMLDWSVDLIGGRCDPVASD